jgi:purine-nucleoside/S-methyl-5'-thioadenosine phosphorylase / adenosine deaminase
MTNLPVERFPALGELEYVLHGFTLRIAGLDVRTDRETALQRLDSYHEIARKEFAPRQERLAEQVHGNAVTVVSTGSPFKSAGADAIVTRDRNVYLGIYVADCCAVYLVDSRQKAVGLAHSGRKGTALNVVGETLRRMSREFGTDPDDVIAQLSPCIRPPHYEVDFAAEIVEQLEQGGVRRVFDSSENTGSDLNRFYSYRMEKGQTGRMLALLALK